MESTFYRMISSRLGFIGFRHKPLSIDEAMIKSILNKRDPEGFKGDYGRVLILAGSVGYSGAAYLVTQAAVRSGAGLVTLCTPKELQDIMSIKLNEAMTINFEQGDKIGNVMVKADSIAIGPGMGHSKITYNIVDTMIENAECPIIIDADGLNVLQGHLDILQKKSNQIILTPHYGEMSRLTEIPIDEIKENKVEIAKKFAEDNDVILLLKDHETIVTDGKYVLQNTTGNSAMASGGMGDALTGIISSFIAQGYEPFEAACIAAFVHGYCGDKLSENMFCVNATHLIEELPFIIKEIIEK